MDPDTTQPPTRQTRTELERKRNVLDNLEDRMHEHHVERARQALPKRSGDFMMSHITRRLMRNAEDGRLPAGFVEAYEKERASLAWLEDGVSIAGGIRTDGLRETAHLVVDLAQQRRSLAAIVRLDAKS
jgi:hypothetical protein